MAIGTGRSRHAGELVERWLEWRQQVRPISPVTAANYRGAIDRYILPNLGRAKVGGIDAATLDTLYARLRATGGKCRHCWKRIRRGEPALRAGVRSGATSTPAAGEVLILSGVVRVAGQPLIDKDTKTHAKRRVAVGAETIELLKAHRARQAAAALAARVTLPLEAYVLARSSDGRAATPAADSLAGRWVVPGLAAVGASTLAALGLFHKPAPDAPLHWSWDALTEGRRHSDTWVGCIVWSVTASPTARTPTTARGARP
jgi:hypothetical protein